MIKSSQFVIEKFVGNDDDAATDFIKRENSNFIESNSLMRKNITIINNAQMPPMTTPI